MVAAEAAVEAGRRDDTAKTPSSRGWGCVVGVDAAAGVVVRVMCVAHGLLLATWLGTKAVTVKGLAEASGRANAATRRWVIAMASIFGE